MVTSKTPISKSKTSTMADDHNNNDTNTISIFTIGSKVEVSSNEPGFHGAWYVATLQDIINIQNPNNENKRYFVKYDTLFEDDNLNEKLTEVVECKFVRPLPPPEYGGVGFEVGDVIDAYYRDGWWIGVVVKQVLNDNDNMGKYVVCFESPYEEVEFEKDQLRYHVDWVDSCWKVSQKKINKMIKTPKKLKSAGKNATQTSESNNDALSDFITPSKGPGDLDHISSHSTKKRTRSQKRAETSNSELVGAVDGSVTNSRNRTADSNSRGERSRSSTRVANLGSKGSKKVPVMERSGSHAITQDSPLEEHEVIIMETSEADDGTSQQKTKSGRPPKLPVNRNDSQEGNQKTRKRYALRDMTTDIEELPLSAWYQGLHPHSVLKRSSCSSPCDHRDESSGPLNQTSVNNGGTGDYQQQWPFIKQSPVWATVESLESYQKTPQKPHFTPLKERKEYFREGLAIAFVVTFADMVRKVSSLQLTDPTDVINNSLEILDELESHGFDVRLLRDRLDTLLTWKAKVGQLEDKLEKCKKDLEKCNLDKSAVEEETNQLEVKIRELQEKVVQNVKTISVKNEEINKFQVSADRVSNQIMEWKVAFEKLVARPL